MADSISQGQRLRYGIDWQDAGGKSRTVTDPAANSSDENVAVAKFEGQELVVSRRGPGKATISYSSDADPGPGVTVVQGETFEIECAPLFADRAVRGAAASEADPDTNNL